MPVYRGPGGAGDATNDATISAVQTYATQAATSATQAAASATNAASSASGASTSATQAATSATTAAGSATTAAGHVSSASTYATNSSLSADDSAASALEAQDYASEAFDYSTAASSSASAAATSATNAGTSATNASNSAASALAIYGNTTAMNAAVASATASASSASTSASTATTQASDAASSADTATTQAGNAFLYANLANTNATAASIDANEAQAAAIVATNQAGLAAYYAGNTGSIYGSLEAVQTAAASATTSANTATTQATNASNSATQAAASAASAAAISLANEPTRHSVRPSLLLDFANTKTLDPRITFTRASTGTYYDGKTTIKAEENLLVNSQTFETNWPPTSVTITSNTVASPDLTTTADTMTATATTTAHTIQQSSSTSVYAPVSGLAYTISVYAKKNTNDFFQIATFGSGNPLGTGRANFDLATGVVGTVSGGTSTITSVGNGWYRCSYTVTASASGIVTIYFGLITTSTAVRFESWTAVGTESIYLWGAQVEQRDIVTAYTATTTAPITNYIPALQTAASGVARFEHNPTTGESLGLEIEEQRTNLVTYSEDWSNAAWTKSASSVTANTVVAPDGTLTADKLVENTATSSHSVRQSPSATVSSAHTFTCYVKTAERSVCAFEVVDNGATGNGFSGYFNLATGVSSNLTVFGNGSGVSASITSVGNGWYRCSLTGTANTSGSALRCNIYSAISAGSVSYTGDGYSGLYIWGAQLEAGAFPTSYIPTVASQVTRSADVAYMAGTNFSSWYRQDEGSVYVEALANNYATAGAQVRTFAMLSNDDQTTYNYFGRGATTAIRFVSLINGIGQSNIPSAAGAQGTITVGQSDKFVLGYSSSIPSLVLDGTKFTDLTSAYTQATGMTTLRIGGIVSGLASGVLNGSIKKLAYYPKRLTNAELQGVTTV